MVMQLHYHVNIVYVQCVSTISGPYYDERSLRRLAGSPARRDSHFGIHCQGRT